MAQSRRGFALHGKTTKMSWPPLVIGCLFVTLILLFMRYNPHSHNINRLAQPEHTKSHLLEASIPSKIWQIFLPPSGHTSGNFTINPSQLVDTASWLATNPDYHYRLVTSKWADTFVDAHFARSDPEIVQTYHALRNPGLKSDLLRYLILSIEGGVYSDTDTECLHPVDEWVGLDMKEKVKLIVGIEFDQRDGSAWADIPHELQFSQWTIAAAPGHPIFPDMAARAVGSLKHLSVAYNQSLGEIKPSSIEVMNSTGPAAWTDVVFSHLQLADPGLTSLRNLSFMTSPQLYGDILVLPIDGFGVGQMHSGSTNDGSNPEAALVRHHFRGSWRDPSS
ncbi:hypothetical protein Daus18300_005131 [Diaporthe australafricana]|uniref:Initiation-specific alpha-1,6-mannosyltransferase n=1 Tax=Diaporthe australafricana TaxID=127596 RepID=A0ABR3X3N6_9PEZI